MEVIVEVHATMDFNPDEYKQFDIETPESIKKSKCNGTMDPMLDIDGIYSIKDGVSWKVASNNWEKYKITERTQSSRSYKHSGSETNVNID